MPCDRIDLASAYCRNREASWHLRQVPIPLLKGIQPPPSPPASPLLCLSPLSSPHIAMESIKPTAVSSLCAVCCEGCSLPLGQGRIPPPPPSHPNIPITQSNGTHQTYISIQPLFCLSVGGCSSSFGQGCIHPPPTPTSLPHKTMQHIKPMAASILCAVCL